MNKPICCIFSCIFIATFVAVVIYYSRYAQNEWSSNISLYVPDASTCLHPPANTTSCETGRPCTYPDVVDFRVIVITFNRADSLSKLLRSLDTLVLDGHRAALEIWIDRDRKNGVDQRTFEVASAFNWKGGATRVHVQV